MHLGCSKADALNALIPASGYELEKDLRYGPGERQLLDIYYPTQVRPKSRVIVFTYGGAWREGEKSDYEFVGHALANDGHFVIVPDYRLYPDVTFPDFVDDVALATKVGVESLIQRQKREGDFTKSVILMGHSSGAHSVSLLAADRRYFAPMDIQVEALIGLAGPYKLPLELEEVGPVFATANQERDVMPIELATAEHPPTLLLHGNDDERVLPLHSYAYAERLRELSVPVALHMLENVDHTAIIASIAVPLRSLNPSFELIQNFIRTL